MAPAKHRTILLAAAVLAFAVMAYRFAVAEDDTTVAPDGRMSGTYLVAVDIGHVINENTALIDPSVVRIGDTEFLYGTVSDAVDRIVVRTVYSGKTAFVPLNRIVGIQKLKD